MQIDCGSNRYRTAALVGSGPRQQHHQSSRLELSKYDIEFDYSNTDPVVYIKSTNSTYIQLTRWAGMIFDRNEFIKLQLSS